MTDGSPLVSIRRSLARVRSEITGMDVRIGVVEHSLLQVQYEWRPIKGAVNCAIYMLMFNPCMFCSRETASLFSDNEMSNERACLMLGCLWLFTPLKL